MTTLSAQLELIETPYVKACRRFAFDHDADTFSVWRLTLEDAPALTAGLHVLYLALGRWQHDESTVSDAYVAVSPNDAAFALLDAMADYLQCPRCGRPLCIVQTDEAVEDDERYAVCHYSTDHSGRFVSACRRLVLVDS
jgi:transcription initiation factor IIE alpha subunit